MKTVQQSEPVEIQSAPALDGPGETFPAVQQFKQELDRYDRAEILSTIRQTVCRGASDPQFRMFIEVCKSTGLDPFLKEIWFVPGVGIMAGRDGYLRVANRHPQFDGMKTVVERDAKNVPIKAVCEVWRKDRAHSVSCEAYFNEYVKPTPSWKQYPSAMIGKVAEVMALKRSFSINGVVTEEEIGRNPPAPVGVPVEIEAAPEPPVQIPSDWTVGREPAYTVASEKSEEPRSQWGNRGAMRKAFAAEQTRVGEEVYRAALDKWRARDLLWPNAQAAEECYRWLREQPEKSA
ncbi:MAG TPA: RecT family recombinase [Rugosimonospora sp.]|nr:RecT family recombinase [Rugosimonospora sp.]